MGVMIIIPSTIKATKEPTFLHSIGNAHLFSTVNISPKHDLTLKRRVIKLDIRLKKMLNACKVQKISAS